MAIVFMGGEMSAGIPSGSTVIENGTAGLFDANFARSMVLCDKVVDYWEIDPTGTLTDAWLHFEMAVRAGSSSSQDNDRIIWYDGSGTARVKLIQTYSTSAFTLKYDVGAGFVSAGSITLDMTALQTIDLRVVCNTGSGSLTLYVAGTERIASGTVDLSAITALNKVRFYGATISTLGFASYTSQVIMASESTVGMRLMTMYPSANGANTAWTGDYTAVDENAYSDADFIYSATNGQRESYAMTPIGSLTGYSVRAYCVAARAKAGSTGPQNLQLSVYTASTNYDSSSITLGLGYTANFNIWETNPNTTLTWTASEAAAAQAGVEANT